MIVGFNDFMIRL